MYAHKKAFTLIELMLVVLIIGLVYSLGLSSIKHAGKGEISLKLENLDSELEKYHNNNHVEYFCIDRCEKCFLYVDGKEVKSMKPVVTNDVRLHRFDVIYGSRNLELPAYFNADDQEESVCFRYEIFPDGSRTEMMVETPKKVIDFAGKFHKTITYANLAGAIEAKRHALESVHQ